MDHSRRVFSDVMMARNRSAKGVPSCGVREALVACVFVSVYLRRKVISSGRMNVGQAGRRGDGEVRMEEPGVSIWITNEEWVPMAIVFVSLENPRGWSARPGGNDV